MITRWRVIVKIWDRSPGPGQSERRRTPAYTCTQWFDEQPTLAEVREVLSTAKQKGTYHKPCYYGEATYEQVVHTTESQVILT